MLSATHAQKIVRSALSVRSLSAAAAQSEAPVGHSDVQVICNFLLIIRFAHSFKNQHGFGSYN